MDQVKKFSIYDELLNKLRDRGCIINNASACIEVLKNIGYYRLSAYFYPFMQEDKTFVEKLSFDKVYRIYEFDRKLRNLLLTAQNAPTRGASRRILLLCFKRRSFLPPVYILSELSSALFGNESLAGKVNLAVGFDFDYANKNFIADADNILNALDRKSVV